MARLAVLVATLVTAGCSSPGQAPSAQAPANARQTAMTASQAAATPPPPSAARGSTPTQRGAPVAGSPQPTLKPHLPPGERLPGTAIHVPTRVRAGGVLEGRVPPGSRVEVDGQPVAVDSDGRFRHAVPPRSTDVLDVRVQRPGDHRPPMPLRVRVVPD